MWGEVVLEFSSDFFDPAEELIIEVDEALRFFERIRPTMWSTKPPSACIDEEFLKHNAIGTKVRKFFVAVADADVRRRRRSQSAVKWGDVEDGLLLFDEFLNSIFYINKRMGIKQRNRYDKAQADLERLILRALVCGIASGGKRTI